MASQRRPYARDDLIEALVLKPQFEEAFEILEENEASLQIDVHDPSLRPRALVRRGEGENAGVEVYVDESAGDHWKFWAACKAVWALDRERRSARTGRDDYVWTSLEDTECLIVLLESYLEARSRQAVAEEPQLERIALAARDGYLHEWVIYEIASRFMPYVTLCLGEESRDRVRTFVERHVVVRRRY